MFVNYYRFTMLFSTETVDAAGSSSSSVSIHALHSPAIMYLLHSLSVT